MANNVFGIHFQDMEIVSERQYKDFVKRNIDALDRSVWSGPYQTLIDYVSKASGKVIASAIYSHDGNHFGIRSRYVKEDPQQRREITL